MNIYQQYIPPSGGDYLKLGDGDTVKVRLCSDPYIYNNVFTNQETGKSTVSTRYAWVVWNYDVEEAQVLQQSATFYKKIAALATDADWGDPQTYDLKITRNGTGLKTEYNVIPGNKSEISEEVVEAAKGVDISAAVKGAVPLLDAINGKEVPAPDKIVDGDINDDGEINIDDIPFGD